MRLRSARMAAVIVATVGGLWAAPPFAQATERYYHGNASTNVLWPFCGSSFCQAVVDQFNFNITESTARTVNTHTVCAFSYDHPSLAPTAVVCSGSLAVKSLCGCQSRFGASRSTVDNGVPDGRARVVY